MGVWATEAAATVELRHFLRDGPQDHPVKRKKLVGVVNASNTRFWTFDDRLVKDGMASGVDIIVAFNDLDQPTNKVTVDDRIMGQVTLDPSIAPPAGTLVSGRYFYQYFVDEELDIAMRRAAERIGGVASITQVPIGLGIAALQFGAFFAYQALVIRWNERMSSKFLLEEVPLKDEALAHSNLFRQFANDMLKAGVESRDDYYKRQGRRNAPSFGVVKQIPPPIGPRR